MRIFLISISILLFELSPIQAGEPGDDVVWKGVHAFYNYKTQEAIQILSAARLDFPENPTVHLTWAAARFLHGQANNSIKDTRLVLSESLNEIIPVYEFLVNTYPDKPIYKLYLGSAIGLRARVHLGKKEWISTLTSAYKGFIIIRNVAQENPDMVDAQLPIGIVEMYAGLSNFLVKWAVAILGLEGSSEAGIRKINLAASHGEFSWIEASKVKTFIDLWIFPDDSSALKFSRKLNNNFPDNFYFKVMLSESLIKNGLSDEAQMLLNKMDRDLLELTPTQVNWFIGYLHYEWALYYFSIDQMNLALEKVNLAVDNYNAELDMILTGAWLLKGQLHDLTNERKKALDAYSNCIDLDNFTSSIKLAQQYSKIPFSIKND